MSTVFVVAEAGVNHNGDVNLALELVEAAASAGVDAVKFQTFAAERLVKQTAAKAAYQVGHSEGRTQFEMLKRLELSIESHLALRDAAAEARIEFMSTPFDLESLDFLVHTVGVKRIKVSSGDLTNLPLLHAAGQTGLPVIVSTGMSNLGEVRLALGALAHGRSVHLGDPISIPDETSFATLLSDPRRHDLLRDITLLQCTSEYPAPDSRANLLGMRTLAKAFALPVGFSDHSLGIHLSPAAVALGAVVIEKHVTMDTKASGPDHRASLDSESLRQMVEAIRSVERALGSGEKQPSVAEMETASLVRRGLYAARDLAVGERISEADIAILRPENGVPPSRYWAILGSTVNTRIAAGEDLLP